MDPSEASDAAAHDAPARAEATATRQRVLAAVAAEGPTTAAVLAAGAHLTPAAVRRHLDALVDLGHVVGVAPVRTGGRGRPPRAFCATDAGRAAVAGSLRGAAVEGGDLALSALRQLRARVGGGAVAAVARDRAQALAHRHAGAVAAAGTDPGSRARALASALDGEGYAATARSVVPSRTAAPGGSRSVRAATTVPAAVQLCQGSCPVRAVAAEFPELCEAETEVFAVLLGTHVRRLATLAHGDHVCTTHVPLPLTRDPSSGRPPPGRRNTLPARPTAGRSTATSPPPPEGPPRDHRRRRRRPTATAGPERHRGPQPRARRPGHLPVRLVRPRRRRLGRQARHRASRWCATSPR